MVHLEQLKLGIHGRKVLGASEKQESLLWAGPAATAADKSPPKAKRETKSDKAYQGFQMLSS